MLTSARDVKITKRGRRVRPNIATPQQIPIRKLCQAMIALSKNVSLERSAGKREKTKQPNRYDGSRTDSALETTPKVAIPRWRRTENVFARGTADSKPEIAQNANEKEISKRRK